MQPKAVAIMQKQTSTGTMQMQEHAKSSSETRRQDQLAAALIALSGFLASHVTLAKASDKVKS